MDSMGKLVKDNTWQQAQLKTKEAKTTPQRGAGQLEAMKNVNNRFLNGKMNKLKGNGTYRKLNLLLSGPQLGQKPMTRILNAISKGDYAGLNVVISELIRGYSTEEYRKENPVLYAIADLIFPTLGDMMGIGNESGLADEGNIRLQNGSFNCQNFENIAEVILETLLGLVSERELVVLVRKTDIVRPSDKDKLEKFLDKTQDMGGDNFVNPEDFDQVDQDVSTVMGAYMAMTDKSSEHNAEYYVKMLSGAKSNAKLSGTKYIQDSVTKVGSGYVGVGFGVYDTLDKIGHDSKGSDWRGKLNAVLDPHVMQYQVVTKNPVQGNYPKEKFSNAIGGVDAWTQAEGEIKEAVNGAS
jgi:hypothetical protein